MTGSARAPGGTGSLYNGRACMSDRAAAAGRCTLGLPVVDARAAWAASAFVLVVYLATQVRDLSVWDSALVATVAAQGGLGHPPGYPLHTWLGYLVARVPGVSPAVSLVWLSAIPAALMCIPVLSLATWLAPVGAPPAGARAASRSAVWLAAAVVAAMAVHPSWWDPATRVEVYCLAWFPSLWGLARLAAVLSPRGDGDGDRDGGGGAGGDVPPRALLGVGLAFGLAAAAHPVVPALVAAAALPALVAAVLRRRLGARALVALALGGVAGLAPYLVVPLVARRQAALVWGAPTTAGELWDFFRGADFARNVGPRPGEVVGHLHDWVGWAAATGTLLFLALGAAGWAAAGRRGGLGRAAGPLTAALAVLAIATNVVWFPENPDYLGYTGASFAVCAAGAAALAARLAARAGTARFGGWALALALLVTAVLAPPGLFARTRARDHSARLLAEGALAEAPAGAVLLIESDHWVWPLLYLQQVEGRRRDVVLLPLGLASSSWYWQWLARRHRELAPFALRGPGGREGRVLRFLAAQAGRPRAFEHLGLARLAGSPVARVGFLLDGQARPAALSEDAVTAAIDAATAALGDGSPDGTGTLALVSFTRGEALWRLGRAPAAYRALLAGVPPARRPRQAPAPGRLEGLSPPPGPLPPALGLRGLGDPAVNAAVAGQMLRGPGGP
jgi:hypothetical protein